ncbi:MAG: hypothetical protein KBT47_04625, partial [Armatimonadetes bacterium]|nr:hypothetical protein [Candidatus Hippobium faecium]
AKIRGAVNIEGEITEDIDEEEVIKAVSDLLAEGCKAFAVGGYASVRNPELSNRIRSIINQKFPEVPVVCSHDLCSRLNAVNSLRTAVSNARLVPVIEELILSVKKALADFGIPEKLLVVKGDGSNISSDMALKCPIETIMSGPAASALGAVVLSGKKDAFVIDIGGTTTDSAVIKNGEAEISDEGALVGDWVMNVDCAKISTTGLGGDSKIDFDRERNIILGPRRSLPLCYICHKYPYLAQRLEKMKNIRLNSDKNASLLDILVLQNHKLSLSSEEKTVSDALSDGPMFAVDLAQKLGLPSPEFLHTDRLEEKGIIKRATLTPTDIMAVEGMFDKWNLNASSLGLNVFSKLYGKDEKQTVKDVYREINRRLLKEIILRHLNDKLGKASLSEEDMFFIDKILDEDREGLSVRYRLDYPIVGIGAPTDTMIRFLEKYIDAEIINPEYAGVANAVGAVSGQVIVKENATIKAGEETNYKIWTRNRQEFASDLEEATEKAVAILEKTATEKAVSAGASAPSLRIIAKDRLSTTSDGTQVFIERNIRCEAKGSAVL